MSETPFNAYELLEILPNASDMEIKRAFKAKALEFHPDKHNNAKPASILFTILVRAKDILLDPELRLAHDYAHHIKKRPTLKEETFKYSSHTPKTDWGSLMLAGVAGLAIGAAIFHQRKRKK